MVAEQRSWIPIQVSSEQQHSTIGTEQLQQQQLSTTGRGLDPNLGGTSTTHAHQKWQTARHKQRKRVRTPQRVYTRIWMAWNSLSTTRASSRQLQIVKRNAQKWHWRIPSPELSHWLVVHKRYGFPTTEKSAPSMRSAWSSRQQSTVHLLHSSHSH
jgi:hypothetical protein